MARKRLPFLTTVAEWAEEDIRNEVWLMLPHTIKQRPVLRKHLKCLIAILGSCLLTLGIAYPSTAQAAQIITWADLQPEQTVDFEATFGQLGSEQLRDLATLAQIRWWLEDGQISSDSVDAQTGQRLERKLTQQGLDVEALIVRAHQVQAQTNDTSDIAGRMVKLAGYALPLKQNDRQQVSQLLLVPFVGACIHVPPPPPNQIIYVEPPYPIEDPGLFTPVWLEGRIRRQPASYNLFRVDGSRSVQVSYAMSPESITVEMTRPSVSQPSLSGDSWWRSMQAKGAALFTQTMETMQREHSPSALLLGVLIAFGYGIIHTLGPGHGKVVIVSYFVGSGGSLRRGISMGARIAFFHVVSAIGVVVLTDLVIRHAIGGAPANYRLVRLASYGVVALIGAWMLRRALQSDRQEALAFNPTLNSELLTFSKTNFSDRVLMEAKPLASPYRQASRCNCVSCDSQGAMGWLSLAIGAVPCSGALLVMLYGLANNMILPAVLMVLAISLGMGLTLSAIGLTALLGRNFIHRRFGQAAQHRHQLFQTLNIAGGSSILLVGLWLFLSTLNSSS